MGVAAHLGIRLHGYDAQIRTFIPHYEEMLDAAAGALRALLRLRLVIVDLGIGSGALAARCLEVVPAARVVGIDSDAGMLALAQKRLGPRLTPLPGDFLEVPLPRCDAIVASLALHHIPTRRRKATFYARCFAALRTGGLLVNADCCPASNPHLDAIDQAAWRTHLDRRYWRARAARFLQTWAKEDVYFRLEEEAALLQSAGFKVDVAWRRNSFAVIVGFSADFEGGFAVQPADVASNVARATTTGIAGLSIEDSTGDPSSPLFEFSLAVERIRAARRAIDQSGTRVLLTGRSEGFIVGRPDLPETIRRLTAYAEAGADCLYAPGIRTRQEIVAVVGAVAPRPVNVLASSDFTTVAELIEAGVRRISVGGALARVAWTAFLQAATEIATRGTFTALGRAVPNTDMNARFVTGSQRSSASNRPAG